MTRNWQSLGGQILTPENLAEAIGLPEDAGLEDLAGQLELKDGFSGDFEFGES